MKTICFSLFALLLLPFANGCSGKTSRAHVKGAVTLDGKPLAKGSIIFETA